MSVAEQQARDSDRTAILRAELDREAAAAQAASQRLASLQADGDATGAADAQRAHDRAETNIRALQRELATTASTPLRPMPVAPSRPRPNPRASDAPWWDVYSHPPTVAPSVVPSPAAASIGHP